MIITWITNVASPYRRPLWRAIEKNHDLHIVLLESDAQLTREGRRGSDWLSTSMSQSSSNPRTVRFSRGETILYAALGSLGLLRRRPQAALIAGWESPAYWQALLLCKLRGIRAVGFYESTLETNRFTGGPVARARSYFFRQLDAIVVPGAAARDAVLAFGVDEKRIFIGFNAVEVSQFNEATRQVARQDRVDATGHSFLFVGQLIDRKNVIVLLRAFADMCRPEDSMTFVGSGELAPVLQKAARDAGIEKQVRFLGSLSNEETAHTMAESHTLVLPSKEEVWGLVVNEALAAGMNVVVSGVCGVSPAVESMQGVYVCEPDELSIRRDMVKSRAAWNGHRLEPEILRHTPEEFADVFVKALRPPA
jgi:glycosyltransferase involved in cell wall biosynthesis